MSRSPYVRVWFPLFSFLPSSLPGPLSASLFLSSIPFSFCVSFAVCVPRSVFSLCVPPSVSFPACLHACNLPDYSSSTAASIYSPAIISLPVFKLSSFTHSPPDHRLSHGLSCHLLTCLPPDFPIRFDPLPPGLVPQPTLPCHQLQPRPLPALPTYV